MLDVETAWLNLDTGALVLVFSVVLILLVLTIYLFFISVWVRVSNQKTERRIEQAKERFYPYILAFLEEGKSREVVAAEIKNEEDMIVFEELVFEYIDQLRGSEFDKLQDLLKVPVLYKYRHRQLFSKDNGDRIQACYYFRSLSDYGQDIQNRLFYLIEDKDNLMSHAAATALLSLSDISLREQAVTTVARQGKLSRMAMLEIMYKFIQQDEDQVEEEAEALQRLVQDIYIPERNTAIMVESIADMGYMMLADFIYDFYLNNTRKDPNGELREALINVLGRFEYIDAAKSIALQQSDSQFPSIRKACARTLGRMKSSEHIDTLEKLATDETFEVQMEAVLALAKIIPEGKELLERMTNEEGHLRYMALDVLTRNGENRQVA